MRKRFEQQNMLDATPIPEVKIDSKSRHQLPKLLAGLQYIFTTPSLNEEIFSILEEAVLKDKKATGRLGMSLWEILVLGVVRLNMDMDYDLLYDQANNHKGLRGILGVETKGVFYEDGKHYALQTLKDNVSLLNEEVLKKISEAVVRAGHKLKKNGGEESEPQRLELKSDTYCVESNIHFPTDLNLLWDSARKCLDVVDHISQHYKLNGWRKRKIWYKNIKKLYRNSANIHRKKGANYKERLDDSVKQYLDICKQLSVRVERSLADIGVAAAGDLMLAALTELLVYYHNYLNKHIDLVERRILKGEKIPHSEKVFSIFEPHVEWIQKGKEGKKVELGHNVLVTSDQYHFIVDHEVVVGLTDKELPILLSKRLEKRFKEGYVLDSITFDRGFYSLLAKQALSKVFNQVVMPKPGKKSSKQELEEAEESFVKKRRKHSAIESNINELEHSGANKVPDKGLPGFKKYVAWSVLAYNLKRLGNLVLQKGILPTAVKPANRPKKAA
jgi:hypothetical protein